MTINPEKVMTDKGDGLLRETHDWLFQHGGCNLVAEIVQQELNLDCYMIFHRYLDYDETGERFDDGTCSISPNELQEFKDDFCSIRRTDPEWKKTSQPIGHIYFIDYDEHNHPAICDGLGTYNRLNATQHRKYALEEEFRYDFTNYNYDPIECRKLTAADFKILNYTDPLKYSSNSWENVFSPSEIKVAKAALKHYVKRHPWLSNIQAEPIA